MNYRDYMRITYLSLPRNTGRIDVFIINNKIYSSWTLRLRRFQPDGDTVALPCLQSVARERNPGHVITSSLSFPNGRRIHAFQFYKLPLIGSEFAK